MGIFNEFFKKENQSLLDLSLVLVLLVVDHLVLLPNMGDQHLVEPYLVESQLEITDISMFLLKHHHHKGI